VLENAGFRVPQGGHFFLSVPERFRLPAGRSRIDAAHFARKLSDDFASPLVVKPNSGKGAKLVRYVRSSSALDAALDAIAPHDNIALVQSFVDEPEFRLFVVDGEIAFAYRKSRPLIEGDGKQTVRTLCKAAMRATPSAEWDPLGSEYLHAMLAARKLSPESVLGPGETLAIDFISNISASGRFAGFIEPTSALCDWARRLAQAVSLRVTGLDLFSRSELVDVDDVVVTDVNGSPNLGTLYDLGHREFVLNVWKGILDKTFDNSWPEGF
jgi:cyanophycin synthetase